MTKRKHNSPWTDADLTRLRGYASEEMSAKQAAQRMGRTTGAVKYKAMMEGIRFQFIKQPRGSQLKAIRTRRRNARIARSADRDIRRSLKRA